MKSMSRPRRSVPANSYRETRRALAFRAVIAKDFELTGLMRHAQSGNELAYSRLVQELIPLVRKMTRRQMGRTTSSDHDDLLQEILLGFHLARSTYDPTRPFIPWLQAIVINRTIDFVRKQGRAATGQVCPAYMVAAIADNAAGDAINRFELIDELRNAIEQLPNGQRLAIELLKVRELTLREAAELAGTSVSALKASTHRAVGTLRISLSPHLIA